MINVTHISKSFSGVRALDDISFTIPEGQLFGFIGPDGAGKTTLFRILITLLLADLGEADLFGMDVVRDYKKIRRITGYMPGRFSLYQDLTVAENLDFFASVFDTTVAENYELIKDIYSQIEPFKKRLAGDLSGGMRQKLALSCALIHRPRLLVLDEPTTGVDAVSRTEFWEMLKRLKAQGITILVSTPYMDEATLCDRVALIQNGKIMANDTPDGIVKSYPRPLWAARAANKHLLIQALRDKETIETVNAFGETVHFTTTESDLNTAELLQYLAKLVGPAQISVIQPNIEDCFLSLLQDA